MHPFLPMLSHLLSTSIQVDGNKYNIGNNDFDNIDNNSILCILINCNSRQ